MHIGDIHAPREDDGIPTIPNPQEMIIQISVSGPKGRKDWRSWRIWRWISKECLDGGKGKILEEEEGRWKACGTIPQTVWGNSLGSALCGRHRSSSAGSDGVLRNWKAEW